MDFCVSPRPNVFSPRQCGFAWLPVSIIAVILCWQTGCSPTAKSESGDIAAIETEDAGTDIDTNAKDAGKAEDAGKSVDGGVGLCNSCHGNTRNAAPPSDTKGRASKSLSSIGAHQSHLGPSVWHRTGVCEDCHVVPATIESAGHNNGMVELSFSPVAKAANSSPKFSGTTCANVYCHGSTLSGGRLTEPDWTRADIAQAYCGDCHGLPPPTPHPQSTKCQNCHSNAANGFGFTEPSKHIDGVVNLKTGCDTCHGFPPDNGTHRLHAGLASPTYGGLGTAADLSSPTGYAFGCGYCHPLDPSRHMSGGRAEVELYNPNAPANSLKARSPSASYVPGSTVLTDSSGLSFSLGTCNNVYCHSGPTYATPLGVPEPGVDFKFTGYPIVYPSFELTIGRAYASPVWGGQGSNCEGCHGFPIRTKAPTVEGMAGQSHSYVGANGYEYGHSWNHGFAPLSCRTCHFATVTEANSTTREADISKYAPVPISGFARHVNGKSDVVFDLVNELPYPDLKTLSNTTSYDEGSQTCSNVACHFKQTSVKSGEPFFKAKDCNVCHRIHNYN